MEIGNPSTWNMITMDQNLRLPDVRVRISDWWGSRVVDILGVGTFKIDDLARRVVSYARQHDFHYFKGLLVEREAGLRSVFKLRSLYAQSDRLLSLHPWPIKFLRWITRWNSVDDGYVRRMIDRPRMDFRSERDIGVEETFLTLDDDDYQRDFPSSYQREKAFVIFSEGETSFSSLDELLLYRKKEPRRTMGFIS